MPADQDDSFKEGAHTGKRNTSSSNSTEDDAESLKKRFKPDYSNKLLTVLVGSGEEAKEFILHKATACQHSTFFTSACSRKWPEGQQNSVRLPEADADAFAVYVHWIYTSKLDMNIVTVPEVTAPNFVQRPSYLRLVKVWILSNYSGNIALCNAVIDRILTRLDSADHLKAISGFTLRYLLDNTSPESTIQQLFVDIMAATATLQTVERHGKEYPLAVIFEFAKRFTARTPPSQAPTFADRCKYHTTIRQ